MGYYWETWNIKGGDPYRAGGTVREKKQDLYMYQVRSGTVELFSGSREPCPSSLDRRPASRRPDRRWRRQTPSNTSYQSACRIYPMHYLSIVFVIPVTHTDNLYSFRHCFSLNRKKESPAINKGKLQCGIIRNIFSFQSISI